MSIESRKNIIVEEILSTSGILVNLNSKISGGVSGDEVWSGTLQNKPGEAVVIKHGEGLGIKEESGEAKLKDFLPLASSIAFGENYAIFEKVEGPTLHDVVQIGSHGSVELFEDYVHIHRKLWDRTQVDNVDLEGYPKKINKTIKMLNGLQISDVSGLTLPLAYIVDSEWIVNGLTIGSLTERLELMDSYILSKGTGVMTHGDEGAGNAIIENGSGKIRIIDNGSAGIRAVHESIAKVLLWFDASVTRAEHFSFEVGGGKVYLDTKQTAPGPVNLAVKHISKLFGEYLDEPEEVKKTSAYMMMYLLREIQWLKARDREDIMPYLLAKSLTISSNLDKVK